MEVKLVSYGIVRDILKEKELKYAVAGETIGDLKKDLMSKYPELKRLRSLRFAVNQEYATDEQSIKDTDEIILIPPVSGG
jgi:molybdopterin synthase sulfur carrier subunit